MPSDDGSSSQTHFVPGPNDKDELYEVIEITGEKPGYYRVKWAGFDTKTGKPWPQDWIPRRDCTDDIVADWKKKKAKKEQQKLAKKTGKSKSRSSRASTSTSVATLNVRRRSTLRSATTHSASPKPNARASSSAIRLEDTSPNLSKRKRDSEVRVIVTHSDSKRPRKKPRFDLFSEGDREEEEDAKVEESDLVPERITDTLTHPPDDDIVEECPTDANDGVIESLTPSMSPYLGTKIADRWILPDGVKVGPPRKAKNSLAKAPNGLTSPVLQPTTNADLSTPLLPLSSSPSALTIPPLPLTRSQILSLRQEEEEESQSQSQPATVKPRTVVQNELGGSRIILKDVLAVASIESPSASTMAREMEEDEVRGFSGELHYPVQDEIDDSNEPIFHHDDEPIFLPNPDPAAGNPSLTVVSKGADPQHLITSSSTTGVQRRVNNPLRGKRLSNKPLRPIPQISPSRFAPHLPRNDDDLTSSIEQFSSPVKGLGGDSSVRDWDDFSSHGDANVGGKGKGWKANARGTKLLKDYEKRRWANDDKSKMKRSWESIVRRPIALNFFRLSTAPVKTKEKAGSSDAVAELEEAMRALQSGSQSQIQAESQVQVVHLPEQPAPAPEVDELVREMEKRYVDLDGGGAEMEVAHDEEIVVGMSLPAPVEDLLAVTASSGHSSDESQDKSKRMEIEITELRVRSTETAEKIDAERAEWRAQEAAWQKLRQSRVATEVQTDAGSVSISHTDGRVAELQVTFESERTAWIAERLALQQAVSALEMSKATALKDVDFFRDQYQSASGYVSTVRVENEELLQRAKIAESQATTGVNLVRTTYAARMKRLEEEVKKFKALSELLKEKDRRTNDDVRWRAAMEPELRKENESLKGRLEEDEAEMDDLKEEMKVIERRNKRLESKLERLERESALIHGGFSGIEGNGKARRASEDTDEDDDDYVPGREDRSSSDESSLSFSDDRHTRPSKKRVGRTPVVQDASLGTSKPVQQREEDIRTDADRASGSSSRKGEMDDMVYMCKWRNSDTMQSCQAVVNSRKVRSIASSFSTSMFITRLRSCAIMYLRADICRLYDFVGRLSV
ncbi:hypothetical protein EW146_g5603 [Bondarzewia mesenterica]|uniref:Chromo domain-containing protein n=1 Tax=Bondarzewia mesenterica TaxID=1095465 RepID=A0A4S4LSU9_9AGAM|nr:hypothetical protein EW146_g5603 [Bondarzewia mesenterica]